MDMRSLKVIARLKALSAELGKVVADIRLPDIQIPAPVFQKKVIGAARSRVVSNVKKNRPDPKRSAAAKRAWSNRTPSERRMWVANMRKSKKN